MSFWKTLGRIFTGAEKVVEVAAPVLATIDPLVGLINPAAKAIMDKITHVTVSTESMIQTAQAGALKKQTVTQILEAELPQLQDVITQLGSGLTIPTAELSAAIDASVAAENAIAKLVEALKAQQKAPPAPAK